MHPREGWSEGGIRRRPDGEAEAISRRQLLGAGAGIALGALLAGCGSSSGGSGGSAAGGSAGGSTAAAIPLPRPNNPVKWPIYADNKPIASGLAPERGATLQLYNWVAYINEAVIKNFCRKYGCRYQLTTFNTMSEAMAKLGTGELKFDVFFPTIDVLGQLVESKLVRPLNQSYITNISNVWPDYRNPFYDVGWQYTTPYSIYTTGMAWRKDKVDLQPSWNMPWEGAKYKGKVAVLDDYREGISLALLRAGNLNVNTTDTAQIQAAGRALSQLATLTNVRIDNNDYTDVPTGKTWIHHAWSGDMASSYQYLPKGTPVDVLGYWFPADKKGPVANDLMVNLSGGANPVLAHLFINYMLDVSNALENYSYVGYMQPLTAVTAPRLIAEKLLPPQLSSTVVLPSYFREGVEELQLPESANLVWESTWNSFSKGL
ncbi:MAG TPA: spermidine/putrescine ABC transporter substrate-binding protein [Solirubrobacteraceae bacterium]|nr:spermidine/putrescine ABC transporter substrate-binding protein [Solirubrobacteraceae bacterium]